MNKLSLSLRPDLGIRRLLPEWGRLFTLADLRADVVAGVTVACIAIPLSLAIALASGVDPAVGLVSAIVGSTVAALFGGAPLGVSGPAAAMAVLVANVIQVHGLGGLLVVGMGCGCLQAATGVLGLGRLIRLVPMPVVAGFTAGIGAIIFIGQLPRALGLPSAEGSHVLDTLVHLGTVLHAARPTALLLALSTVALAFLLPRLLPRAPAPLLSVLLPTAAVGILGLDTALIGRLPSALPGPALPPLPPSGWMGLAGSTLMVYALASLETLLSTSAIDKLAGGPRHDPDQELIGQGLGNLAAALFGGIPITGVIARSALNVQAGARTRRSALVHAAVLLLAVYGLSGLMARIPLAVLAGVLLTVALRMMDPLEFLGLYRSARTDALVYAITFLVIVFVDLILGIQAGLGAALAILALRAGRAGSRQALEEHDGTAVASIEGPLTFLASPGLESLRKRIEDLGPDRPIVLDLSRLTLLDTTGKSRLLDLARALRDRRGPYVIKGLPPQGLRILAAQEALGDLAGHLAFTEAEVVRGLGGDGPGRGIDRLVAGVERFRTDFVGSTRELFRSLEGGQQPHTFFITCADSRINPNLITSTEPGELFIVRNVGNHIPAFGQGPATSEGAAVEFAISVLGIRQIVVCGHTGCGAIKAVLAGGCEAGCPCLSAWIESFDALPDGPQATADRVARANVLAQLEHLRTYPAVREGLTAGRLKLAAWFYDIGSAEVEAWNETSRMFERVGLRRHLAKAGVQFQAP